MAPQAQWYQDAVIYELHVKTFADSNGDGIGDFRGLIEHLDHFTELGVTALWLLPFYPSPLRDDGYDISDYFCVHPSYGTLEDFQLFLAEAHRRGLHVITELVLNHTSDQNQWFQRSRRAPAGSSERDFYVWSDDPQKYREARIIFQDFENSNWTWDPIAKAYFWHRFYSHQPDLNFENPLVEVELFRAIDFWFELGVDGLRLDAVPYLFEREGTNCENLPETHAFLRKLRRHIDARFPHRMLLAEANQWPEDAAAYFGVGDECHMEFHFPLMPRMFMALQMEDRYPIVEILEQTPAIPAHCQWALFLRNHDELTLEMVTDEERDYMYRVYAQDPRARINLGIRRRLAPLLNNHRSQIELINSLLFSFPGTPIIYYGDEIGMGDNFYLGDRNGVRTPMQWSADRNAGFSSANPHRLYLPTIIDPEYHYEAINVEAQRASTSSLFWWMRRMLKIRREWTLFARGTLEFLQPENAKILAYVRKEGDEQVLVVANLSRFAQAVELDLSAYAGLIPEELFGHATFPEIKQAPQLFTLGPHGFYWLALRQATAFRPPQMLWTPPLLTGEFDWDVRFLQTLESEVLPGYLPSCRWFGGKGRRIRELRIVHCLPIGSRANGGRLLSLEVAYVDGPSETYLLPVAFADSTESARLLAESPQAVLVRFEPERMLCDALYLSTIRADLLSLLFAAPRMAPGLAGSFPTRPEPALLERALANSRLFATDHSNTSIAYSDCWFFKFYRRFDYGANPDSELIEFLTKHKPEVQVPAFAGALELLNSNGRGVVGMLVALTPHQGDGWVYSLDALARYFERVLEARPEFSPAAVAEMIGGVYPERARQLGTRTAELHLALGSAEDLPEFAPEPFSSHYQRALYQAMRGSASAVLRQLRRQLTELGPEEQLIASSLMTRKAEIFGVFARLMDHKINATKIRIHGDYHLGQVLNTGKDFVIIDFEGEPRLPLGERRLKYSPLRDVAGMLRSFDYAASVALRHARPDDALRLGPWARAWTQSACAHFQRSYEEKTRGTTFLPDDPLDAERLLEAFILSKALYELGYELSHRPEMVSIPLRACERILAEMHGGSDFHVGTFRGGHPGG